MKRIKKKGGSMVSSLSSSVSSSASSVSSSASNIANSGAKVKNKFEFDMDIPDVEESSSEEGPKLVERKSKKGKTFKKKVLNKGFFNYFFHY
jgi:hypothetical protein